MSRAEAPAKRADELRKEVTDALASPGGQLFSATIFGRPPASEKSASLPGLEIDDPHRKEIAEPAESPSDFLQKLIHVLEETAANSGASYHAA